MRVERSNNFEQNEGKFPYPVSDGVIIDRFGKHPHPTQRGLTIRQLTKESISQGRREPPCGVFSKEP